jgi:hypothetical protein
MASSSNFINAISLHVMRYMSQRLPRFRRGTITGQSGISVYKVHLSPTGETGAADGFDYPLLRAYTSTTVGGKGGPQEGDDVLILETTPGNPVVIGQLITKIGTPASSIFPFMTDSIGSVYGQGKNIRLAPSAPPVFPLTVSAGASGSVDAGDRLIAYSRIAPDLLGVSRDTNLSPVTDVTVVAGQQSVAYSIPPATDTTTATGYKVWTTKAGDTSGTFYLADTKAGIDPTTTVTGTLSAADASLSTVFAATQTTINVTDTVALTGAVPDGTHTHTPMGTLGLGAAVSKDPDAAFTYAGAGNTGAHAFWGLDENAKADLATAFSRNADGTWNPNPPLNITADWTKAGLDTHRPLVSEKLNGMGAFEQGVRTIYVAHTPTDADIPWPSWWGTMPDGWLAINTVDDSLWWRSHGMWHTDDDSGCPDCLSGSGGPTSPGQTTTAGGGQSVAGGSGTIQPPSLGTITSSPAGPTPTAPTTGGNSTPGGAKQGYDCSGAPAVEETFTSAANPGSFGFPFPTTDTVLSTIVGHTITLLASSECDNGNVQTNASRGSNNSAFVLWHFNRGPDLQWVSMGIDTGNSPTLDRNIIGWHVFPTTIETVYSVNQLGAPSGNNDLWFGINFGCDNSITMYQGPDATHMTQVLSPGGWGSGVPISFYMHGMTAFAAGSGTHKPGIIDNFHVYTGMPGWINWTDSSGVVHVATTSPPVFSNPVAPTAPSTVPVGEQTYWTQGYLAGMRGDEESTNPYYTAAMVANMGATSALAAAQAWNQGWVDAWNAQYAAPLKIMPGGSGSGTGGPIDGTASSTTTSAPNAGLPNGTTTTNNLDGTTTTVVTSGATLSGGVWTGGTTTTTIAAPQVGSGGTASTQPVPVNGTLNVAGDLDVGGNTTLAGSLTVAQSSNPTQRTYITPLMVVASTLQSGNTTNTGTPGQSSGTTITKTGTYTPLVHATSEIVNDGVLQQGVIASPAAPASGYGQLYAISVSGIAHPYWMGSDGIARDLIPDISAQTANTVFAGPTTGAAAAPTFRALVAGDLPLATSSAFGAVRPDNSTIAVSGGVISLVGGAPKRYSILTDGNSNLVFANGDVIDVAY